MRVVRWILGIAGAVVLLAVAAVLIATLLINPDHYRGDIESAVRRETGRPFVLEGHLQVTWFPWLGVRTGAARLGNPPGASGPDLLDWQSAELRVRLLPLLLHHQLDIGLVRISGADIHLRRGPHGEGTWDDLVARMRSGKGAAGDHTSPAWLVTWAGLELENGSLDYIDERSREHISLVNWQLSVASWRLRESLSVSTSLLLHADTLGMQGSPAVGVLRLPAAGVRVSLDLPRLRLKSSAAHPLEITAPQLSLRVADASLKGAIDAGLDATGHLTAGGSLAAAVPSLSELARTLGIGMPRVADPAALGALSLSGSWSYREGALAVKPLAAKLDSTTVTGWVTYSGGAGTPGNTWDFALRADHVDFGRYMTQSQERKPLQLPVTALRALRAQGTLDLDRAQIDGATLRDVRLQVR